MVPKELNIYYGFLFLIEKPMKSSPNKRYRSALIIIQSILEELIKQGEEGAIKSHIYKNIGLKTMVGDKYIEQLISAKYITLNEEQWGKERIRHKINITKRGLYRFKWFMQLSKELKI